MASGKILTTHLIIPATDADALLEELQLWGGMELAPISEEERVYETSDEYLKVDFIYGFIRRYAEKESVFEKLKSGLPEVTPATALKIRSSLNIERDYEEIRDIDRALKDARSKLEENHRELLLMEEHSGINLRLSDLKFSIAASRAGEFSGDSSIFEGSELYSSIENLKGDFSLVFYLKKDEKEIAELLDRAGFMDMLLPETDETPDERISTLKKDSERLISEKKELDKRVREEFLPDLFRYGVLLDIYENREKRLEESLKASATDYTRIIKGWIPSVEKDALTGLLHEKFPASHAEFSEADPEDNPPVILKNRGFSRPFELVTSLYGTPAYGQVDPTPFVAPFFILFFGLCLSDAGYGALLLIGSILGLKFFKLGESAKRFLKMLLWGGGCSIIVGAFLGSWFGNAAEGTFLDSFKRFDVLERPELFLYFSVLLGFVHVIFGIIISAVKNISEKDMRAAFYVDIPWLLLLLFGAAYIASSIAGFAVLSSISVVMVFAGVSGILFFSGYSNSSYIARLGTGLYNLYGGIDYIKDMLSYSRLFALGMATGILAMAVNEIAGFLTGGLGYLLIPVVLIGGHLVLNLFMSTLSAYVHTSRLQYVEFFTKFFKGGGRSFTPLSWKNRIVTLVNGSVD